MQKKTLWPLSPPTSFHQFHNINKIPSPTITTPHYGIKKERAKVGLEPK
jgi:hypothetical protein